MEITFYRKLANKVADAVIANAEYSEAEARKIRYGLVCIFSDLYKFILLLIVFTLFSATLEYLLAFAVILLLRPILGGYHAKNELVCLAVSFITMAISVFAGRLDIIPGFVQIILAIVLTITGAVIAPVRTRKVEERTGIYKILAAILTPAILLLDYFYIPAQILQVSVVTTYLLSVYQLLKNKLFNNI